MTTIETWRPEAASAPAYDEGESLRGLFTCLSCQIGFHSADLQRQHFRTDWHVPLLRALTAQAPLQPEAQGRRSPPRHCRGLCPESAWYAAPPCAVLTGEAQQDQARLSSAQANYQQTCVPCKKTFYSHNAYTNHLSSKRHRIASLRMNRVDAVRDDESVAGSIGSGTVSLDMRDSVASLDALDGDVRTLEEGVTQMDIVDEEVPRPQNPSFAVSSEADD